jgi:NADH dehydrogenase [ubiquinone] 1 alpha subcomplex assembly factor 1
LDATLQTLIHTFDTPASTQDWHPINDGVMGGISISRFTFDLTGHAVFEGTVSLQNGGGFASVQMSSLQLGGPGTLACSLTAWGDGRTYKLNLRTDAGFDGVNYQASFTPTAGQWSQIILPISEFLPTFRGRLVQGAPSLRPELVTQVGLMISDKQAGPFRLLVKSIEAIESTAGITLTGS